MSVEKIYTSLLCNDMHLSGFLDDLDKTIVETGKTKLISRCGEMRRLIISEIFIDEFSWLTES